MTDQLFTIDENKSPRLQWMERHGVKTHHADHVPARDRWMAVAVLEEHKDMSVAEIMAAACREYEDQGYLGYGETEDLALIDLAVGMGWQTWHNEPTAKDSEV